MNLWTENFQRKSWFTLIESQPNKVSNILALLFSFFSTLINSTILQGHFRKLFVQNVNEKSTFQNNKVRDFFLPYSAFP